MNNNIQYPNHFIERLHTIWGEGFLSPGGADEVAEIVRGLDLSSKTLLDIGFGTGGPAMTLVKNHHVEKITAIDVESQLYDRAVENIEAADLCGQIDLHIVEPGVLPFEDDSFHVVFSKDTMIHISDKATLFQEIRRVLKPGGVFVASDWLSGTGDAALLALEELQNLTHLNFVMATAAEMASLLSQSGFEKVETRDRNAWFTSVADNEVVQIEGPLKQPLIDAVGVEVYQQWLLVKQTAAIAAKAGGLRPTHLRAFNPGG